MATITRQLGGVVTEPMRWPPDKTPIMITFGFWSLSNRWTEKGDAGEIQIVDDNDNLYKPDPDVTPFLSLDWLKTLKPGMKYLQRQVFMLPAEVAKSHFTIQIPERGEYFNGNNLAYMEAVPHEIMIEKSAEDKKTRAEKALPVDHN